MRSAPIRRRSRGGTDPARSRSSTTTSRGPAENILFGGADSAVDNVVPSDIEIRRNHLYKPLSWRVGDPSYAGTHWR